MHSLATFTCQYLTSLCAWAENTWTAIGVVDRRGQQRLRALLCDSKQTQVSFSLFSTVWLYLQTAQMPRCQDLAIFVQTTTDDRRQTKPIALPLAHVRRVKIKNHYKNTQHKCAESAHAHFLWIDRHMDVMLDKSREEEFTKRQQEVELNRCYLARLIDVAKILAKCGIPFRGHNEKKDSGETS